MSLIDRIELGNKYDVPQWLPEAYAEAFVRDKHLTVEEGKKLGLEVAVKVLKGRDTCKRNGWRRAPQPKTRRSVNVVTVSEDVAALVRVIFPPPPAPSAQRSSGSNWF